MKITKIITSITFEINPEYFFVELDGEYDFDILAMRICERISSVFSNSHISFQGCNSNLSDEIKFSIEYDDDDITENRRDDDLTELYQIYAGVEF